MKNLIRLFAVLMLLVCKAVLADVTFVHTDALGSPVAETNSAGQLVRLSHYNPFGDELEQKKDDVAYTGHKYDADLALSYMQARYYDPVIGRFYSNDPIGFRDVHSFNRYAYANNNPYKYVDLDGMAPNRAGVTTIASLRAEIRGYEKSGLKGAAVMSALSRNHGGNANRYLFTDKHGWVDLRHFGKAAEMASSIGSVTTETLGLGNEVAQWAAEWGDDYRSGFSPEDISSNAAGAAFGDDYMDGSSSVSQSLDNWLNDAGARDPSDPAAGTSSLPATDPAVKGGANRGSSNISNSNHCPATASNCS